MDGVSSLGEEIQSKKEGMGTMKEAKYFVGTSSVSPRKKSFIYSRKGKSALISWYMKNKRKMNNLIHDLELEKSLIYSFRGCCLYMFPCSASGN